MSQPRRGMSLIELLGVMSLVSTALVMLSVWLVLLFRSSDTGHQHLLHCLARDRLARQFREDVHRAERVARPDEATPSVVRLIVEPRRTIDYRLADGRLVREESSDGKSVRRETYVLPPRSVAALALSEEQDRGKQVVLVIESEATRTRDGSPRTTRIAAELGRLHRFARAEEENAP